MIARASAMAHALWAHEFVRYVVIGGINTAIGQVAYLILNLVISYLAAYWITYIAGIALSYVLNAIFVFGQPLSWHKLIQFPLVYLLQLAISSVIVVILVESLGMNESIAPLVVLVLTLPLTFLLSRFILKPKPHELLT